MIGQIVSHYKILDRLGGGSMGVVYKAEDMRLNRLVAVKFLPPAVTDDPVVKERFVREARAASALDHPNICTIYEIDQTLDGQQFLVMAYYAGQTLAEKLREGPLPIAEALDVARQALEGLARAHAIGLIHRDIKPANIMITRRQEAKILDFGLAKFLEQAALTEPGARVGTIPYMSPEQAAGREVDHRSDLWSAAAVLYEMLTGRRPYPAVASDTLFGPLAYREPTPVVRSRPDAPPAIDHVLRKALASDPNLRYQSAQDFLDDLEVVRSQSREAATVSEPVPPAPATPSLLVLPFVNLQPDKEAEYFSDGLTDEIIAAISSIGALRVIARTSAMRLKGAAEDIRKIAGDLNVQYVLEGSVRRSGNQLRVTAKLLDAAGPLIWAEKYDGTLEDVFAMQEAIARKIVTALQLKLTPEQKRKLVKRPIADIRAYEYYLMAKHEILTYSREALERALGYLQSGVKLVGEDPLLISSLGHVYWQFVNAGVSADPIYLEKARQYAERILAQDPSSAHGHRLLGLLRAHEGNTQESIKLMKRALAEDPSDPETLAWLTALYAYYGKPYTAQPLVKKLLEVDPLTATWQSLPGLLAMMAGEFGRAPEPFAKALQLEPANVILRFMYAHALTLSGRKQEAFRLFELLVQDAPENFFAQLGLFYLHALQGNRERALHIANEELKSTARTDLQYSWCLAQCYALIGEKEEALDWLENAIQRGFFNYPLLVRLDPFLDNIRGEPRFEQLMDGARERWEAFEG